MTLFTKKRFFKCGLPDFRTVILIGMLCFLFDLHSPETGFCESKDPSQLQTLQIFFENDLFGDTDKYYTNAVQVNWLSKDLKQYKDDVRLPEWTLSLAKLLPFSETPGSLHNVAILFGQHIYTPADIQTKTLISDDRPYAGFLYTGLALHSKTDTILDTLEAVIGIVGPWAFAECSQNTVHELRSIATAKGWHHQLENEPAIRLSWQRKWRVYQDQIAHLIDFDLLTNTGLTLGNVSISGGFGAEFRLGYKIPQDFGSDVIRPGAGISTPAAAAGKKGKESLGFHWFVGTQLEAVAHNIFLDGNTFTDSHKVDKENLVLSVSSGLAINYAQYKLTYRHLYKTREFNDQKQDHIIGSLTLTISF